MSTRVGRCSVKNIKRKKKKNWLFLLELGRGNEIYGNIRLLRVYMTCPERGIEV